MGKRVEREQLINPGWIETISTFSKIAWDMPLPLYGYGWFIEEKPGYPVKVFHTGDNGGFHIYARRYLRADSLCFRQER